MVATLTLAAGLAVLASAAEPPRDAASEESCSASGPICGGYGACEPYRVADAKCVCRCAGDGPWSEQVRCCLWNQRKRDRDPDLAHLACWGGATVDTGSLPVLTLSVCISLCALKTIACTQDDPPCPGCCQDLPEDLPSLLALIDCRADLKLKHCAVNRIREVYGAGALMQALGDGNACLRAEAAHGLWMFPSPDVRQALTQACGDPDPHVRMWAAYSLGEVGDAAALPVLRRVAKDRREFVAAMAIEAILKVDERRSSVSPDRP